MESSQLFEPGDLRPAEVERLEVCIGKWINEGGTVDAARILTSDVYQW
jgi:hypothetical protein